MFYFLDLSSQLKRIFKKNNLENRKLKISDDGIIRDFYDGDLYQTLLSSNQDLAQAVKRNRAFTMQLNTDGISVSDSSNLSIWPVYLVVNEIEHEERFCFENIAIAGKLS